MIVNLDEPEPATQVPAKGYAKVPTAEEEALQAPGIETEPSSGTMLSQEEQWQRIGKGVMQLPGLVLDPEFWGSGFGVGRYLKGKTPMPAGTKALEKEPVPAPKEITPPKVINLDEKPTVINLDEPSMASLPVPRPLPVPRERYVQSFVNAGWKPEHAAKFAKELESPIWYHGADAEGTAAIEQAGTLSSEHGRIWLTPSKAQAQLYADLKGGKVFSVKREDIPDDLLHPDNIELQTGGPALSIPPEWTHVKPPILRELPKYAGSVNLERIQTDDEVKQAIVQASEAIPKRDPISEQTIMESAAKAGFTLEDAEMFAQTTQAQRAKFLASRNVGTALAERYAAVKQTYIDAPTPENFQSLKLAEAAHLRGFKAQQAVASEAGLALSTFRIASHADLKTQATKTINQLLVQLQDKGPVSDELTKRLASLDMTNPEQVSTLIKDLSTKTSTMGEKIYEAWLNSILSGPQTHAANIAGNTLNLAMRPFDRIGSAAVDLGRAALTGTPRERFASEAVLDTWGMMTSIPDASRAFLQSARTGMVSYGTKIETVGGPKIGGTAGEVVRTPTKLLQATDEYFKALSMGGSKRVFALREAAAEGLTGQARVDRMTELMQNPSETMVAGMKDEALHATFQTDLGRWGKAVISARDEIEPLKYIIPFVKTPTNIAKEGLRRTPLGWLETAADAYHGNLPKGGKLSDDVSKKLIGTGLSAWIATETMSQNITGGGPTDPDVRKALLNTGWKPYAVKVGDTYYPYNRLEPLATWLGTVADATELMDLATDAEQTEIVQKLSQGAAKNLVDKSYIQGMAEMSDALHDPGRYGEKFVTGRLSAVVPSIAAQAARAMDPEMREVRGLLDGILARVPIAREALNPKRNLYGEPIQVEGNFWMRFLSPVVPSHESGTPGEIAIVESGVDIGGLSRHLTFADQKIKLDDDQYDELQVRAGKYVKPLVEGMAASPSFRTMNKEQQQKMLKQLVEQGRDMGRKEFLAHAQLPVAR